MDIKALVNVLRVVDVSGIVFPQDRSIQPQKCSYIPRNAKDFKGPAGVSYAEIDAAVSDGYLSISIYKGIAHLYWTYKGRKFYLENASRRTRDWLHNTRKLYKQYLCWIGRSSQSSGHDAESRELLGVHAGMDPVEGAAATVMAEGMYRFLLVKWREDHVGWVREDGAGRYYSPDGYAANISGGDVITTAYAKDFISLGVEKVRSYYYRPLEGAGWLSPEGQWWPCGFTGHSDMAYCIMGVSYEWLEKNGWVHVDIAPATRKPGERTYRMLTDGANNAPRQPTPAQLKWLTDHGHDIAFHGHGEKAKPVETIEVNGYVLDKKAEADAFARMMAAAPKR